MLTEKKNADGTAFKKMSVEHGDLKKLKIIPDSRIRTNPEPTVRGCTDPYEIRNSYCTTSLWDPRNNN